MKAWVCWNLHYGEHIKAVYFGQSRSQCHAAAASTLVDCGLTRAQAFGGMKSKRAKEFDAIASYENRGVSPERARQLIAQMRELL